MKRLVLPVLMILSAAASAQSNSVPVSVEQAAQILATQPKATLGADTKSVDDPVEFTISTADKSYTVTSDIASLFNSIRALHPQRTIVSSGYIYVQNFGLLKEANHATPVYDYAKDIAEVQWNKADYPDGDLPSFGGNAAFEYTPLSIVGPYVSYRLNGGSYYPGAAHPNGVDNFITADLSKAEATEADLLKLVDETSLVAALKADAYLVKMAGKNNRQKLRDARTFAQVREALEEPLMEQCLWMPGYDNQIESFAIYDYAEKTGLVAVRLPITASAHVCEANPTVQVGLWVKPQPAFRALLAEQKSQHQGLFMSEVK